MKGAIYSDWPQCKKIEFKTDLKVPTLVNEQDSLVVRVKLCCLTGGDLYRDPLLPPPSNRSPGFSIFGEVVSVGSNVDNFKLLDEIAAILPFNEGGGLLQYVVVDSKLAVLRPKTIQPQALCASLFSSLEAYSALHYAYKLTRGDVVLIIGGGSALGKACIDLADIWGANMVIATASSREEAEFLSKETKAKVLCLYKEEERNKLLERILEESGGLGVDCVIEAREGDLPSFMPGEEYEREKMAKNIIFRSLGVHGRYVTKSVLQVSISF